MSSLESSVLNFIQHAYISMQWPGVIALMAIESACIPIPSEIIMPLAGWMLIKESVTANHLQLYSRSFWRTRLHHRFNYCLLGGRKRRTAIPQ